MYLQTEYRKVLSHKYQLRRNSITRIRIFVKVGKMMSDRDNNSSTSGYDRPGIHRDLFRKRSRWFFEKEELNGTQMKDIETLEHCTHRRLGKTILENVTKFILRLPPQFCDTRHPREILLLQVKVTIWCDCHTYISILLIRTNGQDSEFYFRYLYHQNRFFSQIMQ